MTNIFTLPKRRSDYRLWLILTTAYSPLAHQVNIGYLLGNTATA